MRCVRCVASRWVLRRLCRGFLGLHLRGWLLDSSSPGWRGLMPSRAVDGFVVVASLADDLFEFFCCSAGCVFFAGVVDFAYAYIVACWERFELFCKFEEYVDAYAVVGREHCGDFACHGCGYLLVLVWGEACGAKDYAFAHVCYDGYVN